jgi:hypothetical protein
MDTLLRVVPVFLFLVVIVPSLLLVAEPQVAEPRVEVESVLIEPGPEFHLFGLEEVQKDLNKKLGL